MSLGVDTGVAGAEAGVVAAAGGAAAGGAAAGGAGAAGAGPGQTYKWTDQNNGGVLPIGATQVYTDSISRILIINVDGGQGTRCFDIDTFDNLKEVRRKLRK